MKKIKINFCNFWDSFKKENNMFINILKKYFDVELSDNPDFVFVSNRGTEGEFFKYEDCVRIMFMGEAISPDFTIFDYCIGFDYLDFGDRYFRLPYAFYNDEVIPWVPEELTLEKAEKYSVKKSIFVISFIAQSRIMVFAKKCLKN